MIVTVVTDHKVDDDLWIKSCEVLGIKIGLRIKGKGIATRTQLTISCAHGLIKLPAIWAYAAITIGSAMSQKRGV